MIIRLIEYYDADGGFGDAIGTERTLGYLECNSEDEIKAYVNKWNHPYVYCVPYARLYCQDLGYEIVNINKLNMDIPPSEKWNINAVDDLSWEDDEDEEDEEDEEDLANDYDVIVGDHPVQDHRKYQYGKYPIE